MLPSPGRAKSRIEAKFLKTVPGRAGLGFGSTKSTPEQMKIYS